MHDFSFFYLYTKLLKVRLPLIYVLSWTLGLHNSRIYIYHVISRFSYNVYRPVKNFYNVCLYRKLLTTIPIACQSSLPLYDLLQFIYLSSIFWWSKVVPDLLGYYYFSSLVLLCPTFFSLVCFLLWPNISYNNFYD